MTLEEQVIDINSSTKDILDKLIEYASSSFEEDHEELILELKERFENVLSSIISIQSDLKKAGKVLP